MILEIENLNLNFNNENKVVHALKSINLTLKKGQTIGIAGESGCGKTLTSLALMNLLPNNASYSADKLHFNDKDLLKISKQERHSICGIDISMIFQDPMASLNPALTIKTQIEELLIRKEKLSKDEIKVKIIELLTLVGITSPEKRLNSYPYELSGGMCQRVMIAMAISCNPKVLIADEPTTGLDVTIQAQILALLKSLQQKLNLSIIFISHDLSVLSNFCDEIYVMYAGTIVEKNKAKELINHPIHPYTKGLLACIPNKNSGIDLPSIPGIVPDLGENLIGCRFMNRCPYKKDSCIEFSSVQQTSNSKYFNCDLSEAELKVNKWI